MRNRKIKLKLWSFPILLVPICSAGAALVTFGLIRTIEFVWRQKVMSDQTCGFVLTAALVIGVFVGMLLAFRRMTNEWESSQKQIDLILSKDKNKG